MKKQLILWDIESVFFTNDVNKINKFLKTGCEKQVKYVAFNKNNVTTKKDYGLNVQHRLKKIRNNKWNIIQSKKIADEELISIYENSKNKIDELVLITVDRDFEKIVKDSIKRDIKVTILNNANHENNSWYEKYNYIYLKDDE